MNPNRFVDICHKTNQRHWWKKSKEFVENMTPVKQWMLDFLGDTYPIEHIIMVLNYPFIPTVWDMDIICNGLRGYESPHLGAWVKNNLEQYRGKVFAEVGAFTGNFICGAKKNGIECWAIENNARHVNSLVLNLIWHNMEHDKILLETGTSELLDTLEYDVLYLSEMMYFRGGRSHLLDINRDIAMNQCRKGKEVIFTANYCDLPLPELFPGFDVIELGDVTVEGLFWAADPNKPPMIGKVHTLR
jgi:hypothetical protein